MANGGKSRQYEHIVKTFLNDGWFSNVHGIIRALYK